jgi:DNA-binding PucR family transcriptional regulator
MLGNEALTPGEDLAGLPPEVSVVLVAGHAARDRAELLRILAGTAATVGPSRPWAEAQRSYARALQSVRLAVVDAAGPVDTDARLVELVLGADAEALGDLRARVLAPFESVSAASREKLQATLRAWLLHQGRRDDVAAALFVHPQTVRYRMSQLRDLFGDQLSDPRCVLELTVALA